MKPKLNHFLAASAVSVLALSSSAFAAKTWNGATNGSWATTTNWTTAGVPVSTDLVTYGAGTGVGIAVANPTQTLDGSYSVLGFSVGNNAASPIVINNGTGTNTLTIGSSGIILNSSTGGSFTVNADLALAANQTWTTGTGRNLTANNVNLGAFTLNTNVAGTGAITINGEISGTGGVTRAGAGAALFTLTGANTYTGVTTITAGMLSVATIGDGGVAGNLGKATNAAANLVLGGGTLQYTGATASTDRNFTLNTGTTSAINVTTNNLTISGASTATTGALIKNGAGTLTLSGANLYTGLTTVSAGTLAYGANNVLSTGAVTVNGATAVLDLSSNQSDSVGTVTLAGGGSITGSGTSTLTSTGSFAMQSGSVSAILGGTGIALNKTTAGTVTLTSANSYTGATTISAGTLVAGTNSALSTDGAFGNAATAITLGDAATTTNNSSVSLLIGGAFDVGRDITVADQATSGTYTIGGNTAASSTFSGAIALNKNLTITAITGGTVNLTQSISNASGTNTAFITGAGTSNVVLNNATTNSFAPTLFSISSGKLTLGASDQIADATNLTVGAGVFDLGASHNDTVAAVILNGGSITGTGTSALTGSSYDVRSGSVSAILAGSGITLTKTTAGTVTLTGANSYTGATTISTGTLQLGNGTTGNDGTITSASVVNNANLTYNRFATSGLTYGGVISGSGTVTKTGVGTQTLSGVNTYTGSTYINEGTLSVTGTGVLGCKAGSTTDVNNIVFGAANNSGTLEFETSANLGAADQIRFRNTFGGTVGSGGKLNYIGTTDQTMDKTLQSDSSIGIRLGSDSMGGSITYNGSFSQTNRPLYLEGTGTGDNTLAIAFTGSGGITKRDAGKWILTEKNSYSGPTTISAGTLVISGDNSAATGAVSVTGTLAGSGGTVGGSTTINAGGHLAPGDGSAHSTGTVTLNGTLAFVATSIFDWDINSPSEVDPGIGTVNGGIYDQVVNNNAATMSGTSVFNVILGDGKSFDDNFWDTDKSWTDVFSGTGLASDLSSIFTSFTLNGTALTDGLVAGQGQFTFNNSSTLQWSAVPEPTTALAGLLLAAGLFRRKRTA